MSSLVPTNISEGMESLPSDGRGEAGEKVENLVHSDLEISETVEKSDLNGVEESCETDGGDRNGELSKVVLGDSIIGTTKCEDDAKSDNEQKAMSSHDLVNVGHSESEAAGDNLKKSDDCDDLEDFGDSDELEINVGCGDVVLEPLEEKEKVFDLCFYCDESLDVLDGEAYDEHLAAVHSVRKNVKFLSEVTMEKQERKRRLDDQTKRDAIHKERLDDIDSPEPLENENDENDFPESLQNENIQPDNLSNIDSDEEDDFFNTKNGTEEEVEEKEEKEEDKDPNLPIKDIKEEPKDLDAENSESLSESTKDGAKDPEPSVQEHAIVQVKEEPKEDNAQTKEGEEKPPIEEEAGDEEVKRDWRYESENKKNTTDVDGMSDLSLSDLDDHDFADEAGGPPDEWIVLDEEKDDGKEDKKSSCTKCDTPHKIGSRCTFLLKSNTYVPPDFKNRRFEKIDRRNVKRVAPPSPRSRGGPRPPSPKQRRVRTLPSSAYNNPDVLDGSNRRGGSGSIEREYYRERRSFDKELEQEQRSIENERRSIENDRRIAREEMEKEIKRKYEKKYEDLYKSYEEPISTPPNLMGSSSSSSAGPSSRVPPARGAPPSSGPPRPGLVPKSCKLCQSTGHLVKNCPDLFCYKCNKPGHFAKECTGGGAPTANEHPQSRSLPAAYSQPAPPPPSRQSAPPPPPPRQSAPPPSHPPMPMNPIYAPQYPPTPQQTSYQPVTDHIPSSYQENLQSLQPLLVFMGSKLMSLPNLSYPKSYVDLLCNNVGKMLAQSSFSMSALLSAWTSEGEVFVKNMLAKSLQVYADRFPGGVNVPLVVNVTVEFLGGSGFGVF